MKGDVGIGDSTVLIGKCKISLEVPAEGIYSISVKNATFVNGEAFIDGVTVMKLDSTNRWSKKKLLYNLRRKVLLWLARQA